MHFEGTVIIFYRDGDSGQNCAGKRLASTVQVNVPASTKLKKSGQRSVLRATRGLSNKYLIALLCEQLPKSLFGTLKEAAAASSKRMSEF
jgi:hypothetical protein